MCSYDISDLFTCVPILDICADLLYRIQISPPPISESMFVELMKFFTSSVEFSFIDVMYQQIESASIDSVLGPIMANIFVSFHEEQFLSGPSLFSRCGLHILLFQ